MAGKQDYYELLGVPRTATEAEIKRAYRRMARECHPDVNKHDKCAEEKFKSINEAYEVLSDPHKRQMYDRFGHAGVDPRAASTGPGFEETIFGDFGDIFEAFFGSGFQSATRRPTAQRGADLRFDIELSLEEVLTGVERTVRLTRLEVCDKCNGTGSADGRGPVTCDHCRGAGQIRRQQSAFGGFSFSTTVTCPKCHGDGRIIIDPCRSCAGQGRSRKTSERKISIPPGVEDGTRIRINGEGEAGLRGGAPGDLYIITHIKPHNLFERDGANLWREVPISITQAALGACIEIETLDGKEILEIDEGTQNGEVFRLRNRGLPRLNSSGRGDLNVVVRVQVPTKLDERQRKLLREFAELRGENISKNGEKGFFEKVKDAFSGK